MKGFKTGETIFTEAPLVQVQRIENQRSVLACHHCLKFIGVIKKHFADKFTEFTAPFANKCLPYLEDEPIPCSLGCKQVYCSQRCENEAKNTYHRLLCVGSSPAPDHPLIVFDQMAGESVRFFLAAKMLSFMIEIGKKKGTQAGLQFFSFFVGNSWSKISHYEPETKKFEHEEHGFPSRDSYAVAKHGFIIQLLDVLKQSPLYQKDYEACFTPEYFDNLLGAIDLNIANIESLPPLRARNELKKVLKCSEEEVPCVRGLGLFNVHSTLNHSCNPNAEIVGGLKDSPETKVLVVALKDIAPGEEICITYIDSPEKKSKLERQKELQGGYLFDCQCPLCAP